LRHGLPLTGATVHVVTPVVDSGPVLLREEVPILDGDDQVRLHERIKHVEHELLPRAVGLALANQEAEESSWRA
jgi:phosphoribosylglycinamide formyltransferase-1